MRRSIGPTVFCGAPATTPKPPSGTMCGLPSALSPMFRRAVRAPAAPGRKLTVTVQTCEGARAAPVHELAAIPKSAPLAPLMFIEENVRVPPPPLDRVMVLLTLVPVETVPNPMEFSNGTARRGLKHEQRTSRLRAQQGAARECESGADRGEPLSAASNGGLPSMFPGEREHGSALLGLSPFAEAK